MGFLGIDLGTTNSAACWFDGEDLLSIRNATGSSLTPSVVRISKTGQLVIGSRALKYAERDPHNVAREFKRLMGTDQAISFPASNSKKTPMELSAAVLRSLREDVKEQLGVLPTQAVISVPALFELPQLKATGEAAQLAGFTKVELIQEPVASALAAGWRDEDAGGSWLVYDLGGGTFDVSLLESRDGLLRVIGHDGDNFLGGRDLDRAIRSWILSTLSQGAVVDVSDKRNAPGLRSLQIACEEAKISLTRNHSAEIFVPEAFTTDGEEIDVECVLTRSVFEQLMAPLLKKTVEICKRLLSTHGLSAEQLEKVVMVGGPTVIPGLRSYVSHALGVPLDTTADPMTLVSRGAALFAANTNIAAVIGPQEEVHQSIKFWLQHPSVSADRFPHVAGKLLEAGSESPTSVELRREDGWTTGPVPLSQSGGFVAMVQLLSSRSNTFSLTAATADGTVVACHPTSLSIVQGVSLADPPLSRSIGIALAHGGVQVYLERGTSLPAKRTFTHRTVDAISPGQPDGLDIPIVQGELPLAHLCRKVGALRVTGQDLKEALPPGTIVEVTIEIGRAGQMSASAHLPQPNLTFDRVAQLLTPNANTEQLQTQLTNLFDRVHKTREQATQINDTLVLDRLFDIEWALQDATADLQACKGGDLDAGQRALRTLLDVDADLQGIEDDQAWPEMMNNANYRAAYSGGHIMAHGTVQEQEIYEQALTAMRNAAKQRKANQVNSHLEVITRLGETANMRGPNFWNERYNRLVYYSSQATDREAYNTLLEQGRTKQNDPAALRAICLQLTSMLKPWKDKDTSHNSGIQ